MLGRGLESLIPPQPSSNQNDVVQNTESNSHEPTRVNFTPDNIIRPAPPEVPKRIISETPVPRRPVVKQASTSTNNRELSGPIFHIELAKIVPNPLQPRHNFEPEALRELASSIREFGIIQPLLVSKVELETEHGQDVEYQLIAGERRLRAAEMAGLTQVPVIVRGPASRKEQLELAIIENLQREDLNSIEAAKAFARLQDEFNLTQREISTRLGKSRESIANTLRLLSLPTSVQLAIQDGKLNESQGRMLLMVTNPVEQERLFSELLNNKLTVRELRKKIRTVAKVSAEEQKLDEVELMDEYEDPEVVDLKEQLETFFGAPVTIKRQGITGASGKIVIDFFSPEELRGIALKLAKSGNSDDLDGDYGDEFVV
ncbi:MAG: ParB/RepB/Spo0J family partition protein [bacterium]|nr:ParB/RepB/Spo0J family partition protein [bacterium]